MVIHFGSLSSVHVCVFVVESVRYYYLAVSHYTARVYCTSWHEAMRRTPPTLARVSSESPANLAGVSSESLTTLARVSSARSRSPCKHGDCSLLLPERLTRTLTPPVSSRSRPHAQPPHSFADGSSLPRSFASRAASAPPRRRLLAAQQLRMGRGARWPPRRKKGDGGGSQKTQRLLEQSVAQRQAFSAESSRSWPKALSWVSSVPRVLER